MKKRKNYVRYVASVPERTIRATTAAVTAITSLMTKNLVPKFLRESATYKVTFGMLQQVLIQKVAQIELEEKEYQVKNNYIARKTAGSVIEGIGLVSARFSPVWFLAILSDVTGGSRVYLETLIKALKEEGYVNKDSDYKSILDLLEGIQAGTRIGVDVIDMPPLNMEELKEFGQNLSANMKTNMNHTKEIYFEMESVFKRMVETGSKEQLKLEKLSGAMSLDLMKKMAKKGVDLSAVTTATSFKVLSRAVLDSYKESLDEVGRVGGATYISRHMSPFIKKMKHHFSPEKKTTTDRILDILRPTYYNKEK